MISQAIFIGLTATAVMDLVALVKKRVFRIPSLDYALVGRWIGHIPRGRLLHEDIKQASNITGEAAIGWAIHYLIGILFAAIFLGLNGGTGDGVQGLLAAVLFGAATVLAPFLLLQPAMGLGIAARHAPLPWKARMRSLSTHILFGFGLWLGVLIASRIGLM